MRFAIATAAAALVAGVSAASNDTVWVTEVVSEYTTVCPAATQITHNGVTYTATESETITITNCPCTVTHPVNYASATAAGSAAPYNNATVPTASASMPAGAAMGTGSAASATSSKPAEFTGAANKLTGAGAALAGIFAVAAYAL